MTARIVLSAALLVLACTAPEVNPGVGTSPSYDDDPIAVTTSVEAPQACGIWIDATPEAADARSLAGEPPDLVAFATEHSTCIDAVTVAQERYPGRSFVRRVRLAFRAYEAP